MRTLAGSLHLTAAAPHAHGKLQSGKMGQGNIFVGSLAEALSGAEVSGETLTANAGLMYIRRLYQGGRHYFLAYQGKTRLDTRITLATPAKAVVIMDPMTGHCAPAKITRDAQGRPSLRLCMQPNASLILRTLDAPLKAGKTWTFYNTAGQSQRLTGVWDVAFIEGGPTLPRGYEIKELASWTRHDDPAAQNFSGTARYTITFNAPIGTGPWVLNLGKVCNTARVRLNAENLGALIQAPYEMVIHKLKPMDNVLEVEVTNLPANRIRYMDRKRMAWKIFRDANFVNIDYRPFTAAHWPIMDSGLLGPVTLSSVG